MSATDRLATLGRTGALALLLATLLVTSMPVGAQSAAPKINYDAGPNPYVHEDGLTIAEYNRTAMDGLEYYDDDGEVADLPAHVNESEETPYHFAFSSVDDGDLHAFPRAQDESVVEDVANWSTSGASVSDSSTSAEGVTISGSADGDTASYALDSALDDADKRVLLSVVDVDSLGSGASVEVRAVDSDGDYKALMVDPSGNASHAGVMANETGVGIVGQQKLADIPVAGSGDGSLDEIAEIEVAFVGGSGEITMTGHDAEKKGTIDLGDVRRDDDGDGEDETVTLTEISSPGAVALTDLDSMGSWADDSTIYGLTVRNVIYSSADLNQSQVVANFTDAPNYGNYPSKLDFHSRLSVPTAIDLTHSGLELRAEQKFVSDRYNVVELADGVDDETALTNVSDSEFTGLSDTFSSQGGEHVLDSTISPGDNLQFHVTVLLLADEVTDLQDTSGATGGPVGGSGGLLSTMWGKVAATFAAVGGFVKGLPILNRLFGGGS